MFVFFSTLLDLVNMHLYFLMKSRCIANICKINYIFPYQYEVQLYVEMFRYKQPLSGFTSFIALALQLWHICLITFKTNA